MENTIEYENAKNTVIRIKKFYKHLLIFSIINLLIIYLNISSLDENESYFQFENFITFTFWGLGLLAHGLATFYPNFIFSDEWEENKIKEILNRNKNE